MRQPYQRRDSAITESIVTVPYVSRCRHGHSTLHILAGAPSLVSGLLAFLLPLSTAARCQCTGTGMP